MRASFRLSTACVVALALTACRSAPSTAPTERDDLLLVAAGDAPSTPVTRIETGVWEAWDGAELVLALHEPIFYRNDEDEAHARVMVFADGRALYRVRADNGAWQWFVEQLSPAYVETLRASVARDVARTPARFSCSAATHQRRSIIVVRQGVRWRVREGYALSACLDDVPPDDVMSSSRPVPPPPAQRPPAGFVRAYRRLVEFHLREDRTPASPWATPRVWFVWIPDIGESAYERNGEPWPGELPAPPTLPPHANWGEKFIVQPVDGAFDGVLRSIMRRGGLFEVDGERWRVEIYRHQPGDDSLHCAWQHPSRRCRAHRASPHRGAETGYSAATSA